MPSIETIKPSFFKSLEYTNWVLPSKDDALLKKITKCIAIFLSFFTILAFTLTIDFSKKLIYKLTFRNPVPKKLTTKQKVQRSFCKGIFGVRTSLMHSWQAIEIAAEKINHFWEKKDTFSKYGLTTGYILPSVISTLTLSWFARSYTILLIGSANIAMLATYGIFKDGFDKRLFNKLKEKTIELDKHWFPQKEKRA